MRARWSVTGFLLSSIVILHPALSQMPGTGNLPAPPANQETPAQNPYKLQLNVQNVVLDVVVTNRKGEVVTNLTKEDFQVYEDKVPQVIETLEPPPAHATPPNLAIHSTADLDRLAPAAPVNLIVLDEINTSFQDEAFARYSLKQFLDKQGDTLQQPTLLGAVDMKHFTLLHDYTTSKKEILDALDHHVAIYPWHMEGASWRAQQFNASFTALLEIAKATAGHAGHKSLIWVGRGFAPFDPTTLEAEQATALKQIVEACTNALRDARVALYTLDPAGVSLEPPTEDNDGFMNDPFSGMMDFNIMAQATGGHAFYGRNDVDNLIAASTRDGANFYTLTYKPKVLVTDQRAFRGIRVAMKNPDLTAETREGYYAHPPPPTLSAGPGDKKHVGRSEFDLGVAAQSMLVYDAVHITVKRIAQTPDQFRISLNSADLVWQESGSKKLIAKVTVVAETFDKKGTAIDHTIKISTLQVGEGSTANTPDAATVSLFTSVPTKSPAARVRFLVRVETDQKLGSVNFVLDDKNPAGEVTN